jgi:hypothetical protein
MCYSAMIERELAEERERIHQRKIHHLKSKASEAIVSMQHANSNTDTDIPDNVAVEEETETDAHVKVIDAEADDHDDEEKENLEAHAMTQRAAATEELREKLALAFGRVIVACDRLPHVLAPMGVSEKAAAVTNVSAFLIAHSGKWLRQGQTEPMVRVKETREAEDVDVIDSARRKMKAEEEKAEMERRMEERRARKMAMVALARQKKETRVEEIRKQQQQQQKKSNDELDAKAYEDPRGQSELTVA